MKIFAAGRTSAERAALSVARELGLPSGGRCSKSRDYLAAIKRNVRNSDGTLQMTWSGTPKCRTPLMQVILRSPKPSIGIAVRYRGNIDDVRKWIRRHKIKALHVTGHVSYSQAKVSIRAVLNDEAGD